MAWTYAGLRLVKTLSGGPPAKKTYKATVSTAYKEGQPCRFNGTTGRLVRSSTATAIIGVTAHDLASQATVQDMMVYLAVPDNIFRIRNLATGATIGDSVNGDKRLLVVGSTHHYRLRGTVPTAGAAQVRIVGHDPKYEIDDTTLHSGRSKGCEYWIQILGSASMLGSGTQV